MISIIFGIYIVSMIVCMLSIRGYLNIVLINNVSLGTYNEQLNNVSTRKEKLNILIKERTKINIIMTLICIIPILNTIVSFLLIIAHSFSFLLLDKAGNQEIEIYKKLIENEIYKK